MGERLGGQLAWMGTFACASRLQQPQKGDGGRKEESNLTRGSKNLLTNIAHCFLSSLCRGAGLGLLLAASMVGQAAAPLMDLHNSRSFFLHHVVFASFAILSVLSIMLLPESSNRPLPDSLREGENQRRPPLFHARHQHKDHMPLLSPHPAASPYDPDSYARLVTATKNMLGTRHTFGSHGGRQRLQEPPEPKGLAEKE